MTDYTSWHVGMEVVCISAKIPPRVTIPLGLTEGAVYKIRWLGEFDNYVDPPFIGVKLEGIDRGIDPTYGYDDPPFAARRFRPVVNDPLAVFRQIAADPHGFRPSGPEGPTRAPGGEPAKREKVKEVV